MKEQELNRRLAQAVEHAAPNELESVLSRCEERKGTVIYMTEKCVTTTVQAYFLQKC